MLEKRSAQIVVTAAAGHLVHRPLELGEHLLPDSRRSIASFSWNITVDRKRKANQNDTPSTENRETRQQTKSASSAVSRQNVRQQKTERAAAAPVTKSVTLVEAAACCVCEQVNAHAPGFYTVLFAETIPKQHQFTLVRKKITYFTRIKQRNQNESPNPELRSSAHLDIRQKECPTINRNCSCVSTNRKSAQRVSANKWSQRSNEPRSVSTERSCGSSCAVGD